jgi:hypothetical protein
MEFFARFFRSGSGAARPPEIIEWNFFARIFSEVGAGGSPAA